MSRDAIDHAYRDAFTADELAAIRRQVQFCEVSWLCSAEIHYASDATSPLILEDDGE